MVLQDQYVNAEKDLKLKKESLKANRPSPAAMRADQLEIKRLENQLDKFLVSHNDLQSQNKQYRKEIDVCRKQQDVQNKVNAGYNREIKQIVERVKKLNNLTQTGQRGSEETQNQILALKAKHDIDKFNFEHKIMDLQEKLKEKDDDQAEKTRSKDMGTKKGKTQGTGEFQNPADLLKLRLDKVVNNNKEKKTLMDMYVRNVKIIEDAFEQIKETTGISSVEEIVTTFIKAEEQNISLFNYVNMLNSEIDMIEEQNKNIENEIKRHEQLLAMNDKEKAEVRENLEQEMADMKAQIDAKETQIKVIEGQMTDIKNHVWAMVEKFKDSHFNLSVASHMQYDDDVTFNENNVTMYLTELEEYISVFITYLAHREKNPDAPISALSLEDMQNKEFDKGPIAIDAPNAHDFVAMEDDTTADDEIVTNPMDKYRKYEELAMKGYFGANQQRR